MRDSGILLFYCCNDKLKNYICTYSRNNKIYGLSICMYTDMEKDKQKTRNEGTD